MLAWFGRWMVAAVVLASVGCYRPAFEDCAIACGADTLCPDDLHCVAGVCRIDPQPAEDCPGPTPDGAVTPAPDASTSPVPDAAPPPDVNPLAPDAGPCQTCDPVAQTCCAPGMACDLGGGGA